MAAAEAEGAQAVNSSEQWHNMHHREFSHELGFHEVSCSISHKCAVYTLADTFVRHGLDMLLIAMVWLLLLQNDATG